MSLSHLHSRQKVWKYRNLTAIFSISFSDAVNIIFVYYFGDKCCTQVECDSKGIVHILQWVKETQRHSISPSKLHSKTSYSCAVFLGKEKTRKQHTEVIIYIHLWWLCPLLVLSWFCSSGLYVTISNPFEDKF